MSQSKERYIERLKHMVKEDNLSHHDSSNLFDGNSKNYYNECVEAEQIVYERSQWTTPIHAKDWYFGEKIKLLEYGKASTYAWYYNIFNEVQFRIISEDGMCDNRIIKEDELPLKFASAFVVKYKKF